MDTKEQLINIIKDWVSIDNEMREIQKRMKILRNQKKAKSNELIYIMKTNNIDCFDIKDGKINYHKKNMKKPISQKTLLNVLNQYFDNVEKAMEVNNFIMDNRQEIVKETIVRKIC